jgi:hypothetical protein
LTDLIVASTAPQASCPRNDQRRVEDCTAYSRLTIISSLAISDNAADKQISARCVEAFGRNPGIGAAQHSGEWILSAGQRLALVSEIVPARYALHIAVVAFHQTIERRIRCDDVLCLRRSFLVLVASAEEMAKAAVNAEKDNPRAPRRVVAPRQAFAQSSHM